MLISSIYKCVVCYLKWALCDFSTLLWRSPFQAKFTGPYTIAKCYPNNNYLLNAPDRRKKVQVCHVNLLKSYVSPVLSLPVNVVTTNIVDPSVSETSVELVDVLEEKNGPSRSIVEGRLNNSEVQIVLLFLRCDVPEFSLDPIGQSVADSDWSSQC